MSDSVNVVMAQINPVVGDISGNVELITNAVQQAHSVHQADVVVFPEMTITGYPPEDLLFRDSLYRQINTALEAICELSRSYPDMVIVVGYPAKDELGDHYNMAAWLSAGQIQASYMKQNLPNYSVFDEKRYFTAGNQACVMQHKGIHFGILICEDIWKFDPANQAKEAGAEVLLNLNASPFSQEKHQDRIHTLQLRTSEVKLPIVYVNQVGGQDDLVFDGGSFAVDADGEVVVQSPEFVTDLQVVQVLKQADSITLVPGHQSKLFLHEARVYQALVLGVKDYVAKNGFSGVLLGLSGGIDSALTLSIAYDALGKDQVEAVMMPFRYTASISIEDAEDQAKRLGIHYHSIPIESIYQSFETLLAPRFEGYKADLTEENLQARIRGTVLMSISNKTGKMVLATSNKSEVAVGYSTLYGDMVGGFSPLKDVPKSLVYELAKYRNTLSEVIPDRVITRPPSAELRPDQVDQDSLPDYDILDAIIKAYVREDKSIEDMLAMGLPQIEIDKALKLIDRSEYKRRQAAPGIKITPRAFGRDRRYPITNRFKEKSE